MTRHNVKIEICENTLISYEISSKRDLDIYRTNMNLYKDAVNKGEIPMDILLYEVYYHLQQALEKSLKYKIIYDLLSIKDTLDEIKYCLEVSKTKVSHADKQLYTRTNTVKNECATHSIEELIIILNKLHHYLYMDNFSEIPYKNFINFLVKVTTKFKYEKIPILKNFNSEKGYIDFILKTENICRELLKKEEVFLDEWL